MQLEMVLAAIMVVDCLQQVQQVLSTITAVELSLMAISIITYDHKI